MPHWTLNLALAGLVLAVSAAHAAPAASRAADPTDPAAAVPPLRHQSALQRYRALTDTPRRDWRAVNDEVARIGGWRAYLREAHAPEPAASAPAPGAAPVHGQPGQHRHGGPR